MDERMQPSPKPWLSRVGWLILMALLAWNLWILWPRKQVQILLPYSDFLSEVRADNVAQMKITGSEIQGAFIKPVVWNGQTTSSSPGTQDASTANDSYLAFRTTF